MVAGAALKQSVLERTPDEIRKAVLAWLDRFAVTTEVVPVGAFPPPLLATLRDAAAEAGGDGGEWAYALDAPVPVLWLRVDSFKGGLLLSPWDALDLRLGRLSAQWLEQLRSRRAILVLDWSHEGQRLLATLNALHAGLRKCGIPPGVAVLLTQNRAAVPVLSRLCRFEREAIVVVGAHHYAAEYWRLLTGPVDEGAAEPLARFGFALDGGGQRRYRFLCMNHHLRPSRAMVVARLRETGAAGWISFSTQRRRDGEALGSADFYRDVERLTTPGGRDPELARVRALIDAGSHFASDIDTFVHPNDGVFQPPVDAFRDSELYVVTETEMSAGAQQRYTEKTLKAIVAGIPFVVFGNPDTVGWFARLGFDVLDDFIDHGYDAIRDPARRFAEAWSQVERFLARAPGFSADEMERLRRAAIANRRVFERVLPVVELLEPLSRIAEVADRSGRFGVHDASAARGESSTYGASMPGSTQDPRARPLVTVAVPSFNQGAYLERTLESLFEQSVPIEVFVADAGSTDGSVEILERWSDRLAGWRSRPDEGQAAAINECIARGSAPFVYWLNSDDYLLPGGLDILVDALIRRPAAPMVYGDVLNLRDGALSPLPVAPFSARALAWRCIVSQPGAMMRRSAWEAVGGVREDMYLAFDYALWWSLAAACGPPVYLRRAVAVNRDHLFTKTNSHRRRHYREAIDVVREHYGRVPFKWYLAQPYAVWWRALMAWCGRRMRGAPS